MINFSPIAEIIGMGCQVYGSVHDKSLSYRRVDLLGFVSTRKDYMQKQWSQYYCGQEYAVCSIVEGTGLNSVGIPRMVFTNQLVIKI